MRKRRFVRFLFYLLAALLVLVLAFSIYYNIAVQVSEPTVAEADTLKMERVQTGPDSYTCDHGWLRKDREGWWVMYLEGSPYEIGYAHGLLTQNLMYEQEKAFLEKLAGLIPSKFYQRFMLGFVRYFNRDLDSYVKEEYREEIYGVSRFASPEFDFMGPAYARMLNYHAAHDIGHAMQNMDLVACTAFGDWGSRSADSNLILGRNFDFYVNDDFAKNKILCFIKPDSGYKFAFITWASFIGVVSGMNEKGLTITLNADKSAIPFGAKTPVSLLAREILQYASNIDEAYKIAKSHETFVAESFLIGSAADHKAVVIEKSPEQIAIFDPDSNQVTLTNHYQSEAFKNDPLNVENIANETSVYRLKRIDELLAQYPKIDPVEAASVLRDYRGLEGKDIGLGNEKAVNQYIAHHSVIFQPVQRRIWVSGPPWQLGAYWPYDLDSISAIGPVRRDAKYCVSTVGPIPADTVQLSTIYPRLQKYRTLAQQIQQGIYHPGDADSLIKYNPEYFWTYRILGDYCKKTGVRLRAESAGPGANGGELGAADFYRIALEKVAPSAAERKSIVVSR